MRKLKLQMQITVDGYVATKKSELDWMTWNWGDDLKTYVKELTGSVDTIIMGKNLAMGFIPYWTDVAANADNPDHEFGRMMTDMPKFVFTKTLDQSVWENTKLAKGDLKQEIDHLKNQEGKDIIVYGGADFVSGLIQNNLIDELHLFVNPVAIGDGMKIFKERTNLSLVKYISFDCGINVAVYKPKTN